MKSAVVRFLDDGSGSAALEYAIAGSVISIALVLAAVAVGSGLNGLISAISPHFN